MELGKIHEEIVTDKQSIDIQFWNKIIEKMYDENESNCLSYSDDQKKEFLMSHFLDKTF